MAERRVVWPNVYIVAPPNVEGASLHVPIHAIHASPEYYLASYEHRMRSMLVAEKDITSRLADSDYTEILFAPGVPFVVDEDIPAGLAYFEHVGMQN